LLIQAQGLVTIQVNMWTLWCFWLPIPPFFLASIFFHESCTQHFATFYVSLYDIYTTTKKQSNSSFYPYWASDICFQWTTFCSTLKIQLPWWINCVTVFTNLVYVFHSDWPLNHNGEGNVKLINLNLVYFVVRLSYKRGGGPYKKGKSKEVFFPLSDWQVFVQKPSLFKVGILLDFFMVL
jgi:hypothetical protein